MKEIIKLIGGPLDGTTINQDDKFPPALFYKQPFIYKDGQESDAIYKLSPYYPEMKELHFIGMEVTGNTRTREKTRYKALKEYMYGIEETPPSDTIEK